MTESRGFDDNPFRALDARHFPEKRDGSAHAGGQSRRSKPGQKRPHADAACGSGEGNSIDSPGAAYAADAADSTDAADAALFQAAMRRVTPSRAGGGFALGALCDLPGCGKAGEDGNRARRKRARGQAATGAAERPADAASPSDTGVGPFTSDAEDGDAATFLRAMQDTRPLGGRGRDVRPAVDTPEPRPVADASFEALMAGPLEFALTCSDEYLEGHVVGLDPLIMGRLRAGNLSPEAHLDLHGPNALQAFEALRGFMRGAWYKGLRVVLVVPGRGRNSPQGMGVLRERLQVWLTQEPFKRVVLAFCTAQPHDGGPGSVYVLLRKFRKKGRICWERMPADADLY